MLTPSAYQAAIKAATRHSSAELWRDFEKLKQIRVTLPKNEPAYRTLPRVKNQWRLPLDSHSKRSSDKLLMLPVRDEQYAHNAYMAVIPQPIIMHQKIAATLENYAQRLFEHYPEENSLAGREYGVPMLIGRFDAIVDKQGNIQICELDDVCSLWPALPKINPIAESYLRALEDQMGLPIYTAEMFQYADGAYAASPRVREQYSRISYINFEGKKQWAFLPRSTPITMAVEHQNGIERIKSYTVTERSTQYFIQNMRRLYLHNEDHWRGDINDAWLLKGEKRTLDEVALSVRAYRDMPGFREHLDRYGPRSITMAWERDSKWSLVAEKLAVLAANLDVAVSFGKEWQAVHPDGLLVFKTLYSARTEHTAIFSSKGTKLKGVSSASQIRKKFGADSSGPIVIQPYKEPDNLTQAGVHFVGTLDENLSGKTYTDRKRIRSVEHVGSTSPGERVVAGMEQHFAMIFRSFVIYLPKEKRLVHIGGMWQATDGRIVHGGAHSVAGPLYVDGLPAHPQAKRTKLIKQAETLLTQTTGLPSPLGR